MKVILTKDVPKVGRQFDLKTVADGFALNFLFPRGLAELATAEKMNSLEKRQAAVAHLKEADASALAAAFKKLDGMKVSIKSGKANDQGHLYKGVGVEEIAESLSKAAGAKISSNMFTLEASIKVVGEHTLTLHSGDEKAHCMLVVEAGD